MAGLLAERDVQVDLLHGAAAADAIARGRERGLVVVDTDTTSPVDTQGVAALGDTLAPLGLDAIYLTLPATMSAPAARGLLDGLEALAPTALVITHADEANELGIVAELAYLSGLPIAFIHGGLDLDTALSRHRSGGDRRARPAVSEFLFQPPSPVRLIPAGHQGKLTAPGHESMPVRVFERGSDVLMLVVLLDADTGVEPERTEPVLLEYSSVQGLVRMHGEARLEQRDLIRFTACRARRGPAAPRVRAHRRAPAGPAHRRGRHPDRHPCGRHQRRRDAPARARAPRRGRGAALLAGSRALTSRRSRAARVSCASTRRATAVWSSRPSRPRERQRLIHFIFDRQRVARAKTRDGARNRRRAG